MPVIRNLPDFDPAKWLIGAAIADFKPQRYGRMTLFPDSFSSVDVDGTVKLEPIMIRVPGEDDLDGGRIDAINLVAKKAKRATNAPKIETIEDARRYLGTERVENMETAAIVARCCYEPPDKTLAEGQLPPLYMTFEMLRTSYLAPQIYDVWDHMEKVSHLLNPRLDALTEDQFWTAAAGIARHRNVAPLGAMRADTQRAFVVEACTRLCASQTSSSTSTSGTTSTAEP